MVLHYFTLLFAIHRNAVPDVAVSKSIKHQSTRLTLTSPTGLNCVQALSDQALACMWIPWAPLPGTRV